MIVLKLLSLNRLRYIGCLVLLGVKIMTACVALKTVAIRLYGAIQYDRVVN